jgi:hypothetical protein
VYDIETERNWGRFLVGGALGKDGEYVERTWRREQDFAEHVGAVEGRVWAHSGGTFDHKWWLSVVGASERRARISVAGGRLVSVRSGNLELLDSLALAKISLRDLTRGLAVEKGDHGLSCLTPEKCGLECGGFCRFHRRMPGNEFAKVREYLEKDCRSLGEALTKFEEFGAAEDIDLCYTVGGSAWRCAQRRIGLPDAELTLRDHEFVRKGYYGGRVQIFRPEANEGREYDVNAMYPAALASLELPWGDSCRRVGSGARSDFQRGLEGVVRARVSVPEMWIPPLPVRTKSRSAYPTGIFEGHWTAVELRYAETVGVKILEVKEGIFWPEKKVLFRDWIDQLWSLRFAAQGGKSGPFGTFLKFYMNSLTGKLGMNPESTLYTLNPDPEKLDKLTEVGAGIWSYDGPKVRKTKDGRWVAGSPCCHVEWAGYITAIGRIRWHRQATAGPEDMVMGDTDSVLCTTKRTKEVGNGLGEWQDKGGFASRWVYNEFSGREEWRIGFEAIAPKFYRYFPSGAKGLPPVPEAVHRRENEFNAAVIKSKGVPRNQRRPYEELFRTGVATFYSTRPSGFREGARSGRIFRSKEQFRRITRGYGDRIFDYQTGVTNPPRAQDLELI